MFHISYLYTNKLTHHATYLIVIDVIFTYAMFNIFDYSNALGIYMVGWKGIVDKFYLLTFTCIMLVKVSCTLS